MKYRPRIVDSQLKLRMEAFGAVQIVGPKGCGKTTTAKLGQKGIADGIRNLNTIESLIEEKNQEDGPKIRPPDLKIVITGTEEGYVRDDGVVIVPIGCLKPRCAGDATASTPFQARHPAAQCAKEPTSERAVYPAFRQLPS